MTEKILCKEKLLFQKRWLEYIPNFWNINETYRKNVFELSEIELERLLMIKKSKRKIEVLRNVIKKIDEVNKNDRSVAITITEEENEKIDDVLASFSLNEIALAKLNANELFFINKMIKEYDGKDDAEIVKQVGGLPNPYAKEYCSICLKSKKEKINIKKLKKA